MPRFKSVDFFVRNRRPAVVTAQIQQIQECIANPDHEFADQGVISFDLACFSPTYAGNTGSTQIGSTVNKLGNKPFIAANPDVATLFSNYSRGIVYASELEVHAYPVPSASRAEAYPLESGTEYSAENDVTVTCSNSAMAHGSSQATVQTASDEGNLRRLYNTKSSSTRTNVGAPATGATLKSRYFPRAQHQVKDLLDNLDDFRFYTRATGLITAAEDPTYDSTLTPGITKKSYWTVTITPKAKIRKTAETTGAPGAAATTVPGRVYPHRLSLRITWSVMFYVTNPTGIPNVPLSGGQSMATDDDGGGGEGYAPAGVAQGLAGAALVGAAVRGAQAGRNVRRRIDGGGGHALEL